MTTKHTDENVLKPENFPSNNTYLDIDITLLKILASWHHMMSMTLVNIGWVNILMSNSNNSLNELRLTQS